MLGHARDPVTDEVLNAMADTIRRRLLFYIYEQGQDGRKLPVQGASVPDFEERNVQVALYHVHIPRLEEAGYINWNGDARTISKGPEWVQIEPLLRLIYGHMNELPDNLKGTRSAA